MTNVETLMEAGVVPGDHTLTSDEVSVINGLSASEVQALISIKQKLGDDFIQRNVVDSANCFL